MLMSIMGLIGDRRLMVVEKEREWCLVLVGYYYIFFIMVLFCGMWSRMLYICGEIMYMGLFGYIWYLGNI